MVAPVSTRVRTAYFDASGRYRYSLDRLWDATRPPLVWIMLNPSRADQWQEDPTTRRCLGLSQRWQYGSCRVVNLFAYCTPCPQELRQVSDPIGADNDGVIDQACDLQCPIVLAWGNGGTFRHRHQQVLQRLVPYRDRLYCLGLTRQGQPRHPLYVPSQTQLLPWSEKGGSRGVL